MSTEPTLDDLVPCEVADGIARGQTILRPEGYYDHARDWDGRPSCKVAVTVDAAAFLKFYRDTIVDGAR